MGIFDSVKISVPKELDDRGELPVQVSVIERKARTIGFGVSFSTDEGFGGETFWRHRNFFGQQESLKVTATLSEIRQALALDIEKPNFVEIDQSLLINSTLLHQQSDAFDEKSASGFVGLKRKLDGRWELTFGVAPEYSKVDDNESEETWIGIGTPVTLRHNTTDNALDPTTGHRFMLSATPTFGELSELTQFIRTEFKSSIYFAPFPTDRVIFAARGRIGSIIGEATDEVPANHRFYAGGGGSIRGYEFQSVGPLDSDDDPVGGRSVIEVGAELRLRATETIGFVPFVEGGTAYDSSIPDADREIRWAAGLGLRYFTAIGPLRLDFAFPLNRRKGIDDSFQFYVSIGQAF
jgi:translocation and assembly module TamA